MKPRVLHSQPRHCSDPIVLEVENFSSKTQRVTVFDAKRTFKLPNYGNPKGIVIKNLQAGSSGNLILTGNYGCSYATVLLVNMDEEFHVTKTRLQFNNPKQADMQLILPGAEKKKFKDYRNKGQFVDSIIDIADGFDITDTGKIEFDLMAKSSVTIALFLTDRSTSLKEVKYQSLPIEIKNTSSSIVDVDLFGYYRNVPKDNNGIPDEIQLTTELNYNEIIAGQYTVNTIRLSAKTFEDLPDKIVKNWFDITGKESWIPVPVNTYENKKHYTTYGYVDLQVDMKLYRQSHLRFPMKGNTEFKMILLPAKHGF